MELWEYQVIHLNVEAPVQTPLPPPAAPPAPPSEPAAAGPPQPVFSREYLEKEFPGFYTAPADGGPPRSEHPAQQLRGFLNGQGREGWLLIGFFPVGQLTMMVFRRPLRPQGADEGPAEEPDPLLARLEALERRLGARQAAAASPPVPSPVGSDAVADRQRSPGAAASGSRTHPEIAALQDGDVLSEDRLRELELPRCSTAEAAHALGFRSPASLLNVAARSGYRPGLIKRGINGWMAIYAGSCRNERGGRDRRWWLVLPPSD